MLLAALQLDRYTNDEQRAIYEDHVAKLNLEQHRLLEAARSAVLTGKQLRLSVCAPGGAGKSFTMDTIAAFLRMNGHIVLMAAPTGKAQHEVHTCSSSLTLHMTLLESCCSHGESASHSLSVP